jgi:flagellar biosynthetic protein FliR
MDALLGLAVGYRTTFLLVFFRLGAMLAVAPVLGHRSIPVTHRVGMAVMLALVLTPVVGRARVAGDDVLGLGLAIGGEILIGIAIGTVAALVVAAVHTGAELVGFQMGLGMGAVFDPSLGGTATVFTRMQEMLALLLFLAVDGHHALVLAVAGSFQRLTPGLAFTPEPLAAGLVSMGGSVFRSGLELSAPLVGVLFLLNVVLALLARVSPSMNVFALSMPAAIAAGLIAFVAILPGTMGSIARLFAGVPAGVTTLFLGGGGGR